MIENRGLIWTLLNLAAHSVLIVCKLVSNVTQSTALLRTLPCDCSAMRYISRERGRCSGDKSGYVSPKTPNHDMFQ